MRENLQLVGVMASILGLMAIAGLTIGATFRPALDVPAPVEVQPVPSPSPKSARRVRVPKVDVRLTYEGVSSNSSEGANEGVSPNASVSAPTEYPVADAECCTVLPVDEPAAQPENSGFANLALPYFSTIDETLR